MNTLLRLALGGMLAALAAPHAGAQQSLHRSAQHGGNIKMAQVHILDAPLMLEGSAAPGRNYLLPAGTPLYFERAMPEGFVTYRVYINVEGVRLDTKPLSDPTTIMPLTAYPIGPAELSKLLKEEPLTRAELSTILNAGYMSKEEIRQVLEEFSR